MSFGALSAIGSDLIGTKYSASLFMALRVLKYRVALPPLQSQGLPMTSQYAVVAVSRLAYHAMIPLADACLGADGVSHR